MGDRENTQRQNPGRYTRYPRTTPLSGFLDSSPTYGCLLSPCFHPAQRPALLYSEDSIDIRHVHCAVHRALLHDLLVRGERSVLLWGLIKDHEAGKKGEDNSDRVG